MAVPHRAGASVGHVAAKGRAQGGVRKRMGLGGNPSSALPFRAPGALDVPSGPGR